MQFFKLYTSREIQNLPEAMFAEVTGPNDPALVMVLATLEVTNVDVVDRETDVVFIRGGLLANEVVVMGGATVLVIVVDVIGIVIVPGGELEGELLVLLEDDEPLVTVLGVDVLDVK